MIKTAKEFAKEVDCDDLEWAPITHFALYRTDFSRFIVRVEQMPLHRRSFERSDALIERDIDVGALDVNEFARDFINDFCNHLSEYDIDILQKHLALRVESMKANRNIWR